MRKRGVRVAGILLTAMIAAWATAAIGADARSYVSTQFGLELDGQPVGIFTGFEGGVPYGEVVDEAVGPDRVVRKHVGALRYEDITITAPLGMGKEFYVWIQESLAGRALGRSGAIVMYDHQFNEASRMTFNGALISEITLPKADLAIKTPAFFTVKIKPQSTRFVAPQGKKPPPSSKSRTAGSQFFRLRINGLEQATTKASSADAGTIKVDIAQNTVGDPRSQAMAPGKIRIPNLSVTTRDAKPFYDWSEDFLVRGNNSSKTERTGILEYTEPDGKTVLLTVTFRGLGMVKVAPIAVKATGPGPGAASSSGAAGEVKAEMYCEEISLVSSNRPN